MPSLTLNLGSEKNFTLLADLLRAETDGEERPRVLIVGAGDGGAGADVLLGDPRIECVESDVAVGPRTQVVCDAHDLLRRRDV